MKAYGIIFKEKGKEYKFKSDKKYYINDIVIVETERGLQLGTVKRIFDKKCNNLKNIKRKASKSDLNQHKKNLKDSSEALEKSKELAKKLDLNMKFIDASFTFDRNQLLLLFTAESRVDFRTLAKELASIYKTRIELRQIGIRDKAKEVSGIGQCGRKLCCASFLTNLESVSISMVKNQNLALNPNKINGQCGRLLCCLNYEDDMYTTCREGLPNVGDKIDTEKGEATVTFVDILNRTYTALTKNEEKITIKLENECDKCENRN